MPLVHGCFHVSRVSLVLLRCYLPWCVLLLLVLLLMAWYLSLIDLLLLLSSTSHVASLPFCEHFNYTRQPVICNPRLLFFLQVAIKIDIPIGICVNKLDNIIWNQ